MFTYVLNQCQNYSVQEEYKKLIESYLLLKENAKSMYNIGLSEEWEHVNFLNDFAISDDGEDKRFFIFYENDRKELINFKLNHQYLKEEKIKKIFEMKNKRLNFHIDRLSESSLGTTLNLLEEFYENVYRDLERNTVKERDFTTAVNNMFEYKFDVKELEGVKKEDNYTFN